jgi:two-component system chemotaxis sensor kinase CheA
MNLDQALKTYIEESRELLQEIEDGLLRVEQEADTADTVNAIFRAAHTIKGSAGLFGLDYLVAFTHGVESVLDRVRDGSLGIDAELVALMLECRDHISALVEHAAEGAMTATPELDAGGQTLTTRLNVYLGKQPPATTPAAPEAIEARVEASGGGRVGCDCWHISLRFGRESLRNGMDPLSFLRYLATLGDIVSIETLTDALPAAADMDPEQCYLGYEIKFRSDADKATIEGVFEFALEDSQIHILPPRGRVADYLDMIKALPEDDLRLGEILCRVGSLTEHELQEALGAQAAGAQAEQGEATEPAPIGDILVGAGMVQPELVDAALDKQKQTREHRAQESRVVRVDADKLDRLINLVGELVIAGASTNLIAQRAGMADLLEATSTLSRLVEEVRDSALTLRMVQIGATFSRFQRVVRDVSRELGKEIQLVITGAETELDKTVVEKIGDPLMHLVRNSMDHGIEAPDARVARGKPAQGTLRLNAYHDSGSIVIEVGDDGGGLNRQRILDKAIERGIVQAGQNLSDQEICQLIFEPGFSTAAAVTNLSGRGVGMDVVRKNIEALRGTIEIDSVEGQGTTIRIRLPLTLAIIDGFLVGIGGSSFVIPLEAVAECVELSEADRAASRDRHYLNLRGEVLPFLRLREVFDVDGLPPRRENVVVVQYGKQRAGLVVDELMGEFQTVIKPLGRLFGHIRGIGGSTILGSGEVALILDVPSLVQRTSEREGRALAPPHALSVQ